MDQFDDDFASHWDEFVGWDKRDEVDSEFLFGLIKKYGPKRILDVAMGTGFHTISLLRKNLEVKSCDVSKSMIAVAHKNALNYNVSIDAVCCDWIDIEKKISSKFDCVICLGNSLACENSYSKRKQSVKNWSNLLTDNGIVIVDRRNYELLLSGGYNLNSKGQYFGENVQIKSDKLSKKDASFSYTFSTGKTFNLKMSPILHEELIELFSLAGMELVEVYGDRSLEFVPDETSFYYYVLRRKK